MGRMMDDARDDEPARVCRPDVEVFRRWSGEVVVTPRYPFRPGHACGCLFKLHGYLKCLGLKVGGVITSTLTH